MTSRRARRRAHTTAAGPRLGLFGLLGQGNLGNDGSLEAVLAYLRAEHPDVMLDALCSGPELVSARYGIPAARLRWYHPERQRASGATALALRCMGLGLGMGIDALRTASWVRRHDAVIVPGMGVLEATVPMRPWQTPYSMFLLCASGRLLGTKVALVSVGTNVIHQRLTRWLTITAARLAHYRSYRDTISRDAMRRMGLDTSGDAVYPDVVFSLPTPPGDQGAAGTVGIGVMDYSGGNDDRQEADEIRSSYIENMTRFSLWLVDNGHPIRLFTSDSADERIVRQILADLRVQRPALDPSHVIAESVPSLDELMRQTASVDTVVATRYHNVLYALKMAKPTLSLSYAAKHDALMAEMGLSGYCQPVRSLDIARLIEQFTELESRSAELRRMITQRNAEKARLVDCQFAELSTVLFSAAGAVRMATRPKPARTGPQLKLQREMTMNDAADGKGAIPEERTGSTARYYKKDFWSEENLKFSEPHYRLEKVARIINKIAHGKECTLLDVGCGPAALMRLLHSNIQYYGIDMAIHDPAPNLIEADLLKTPIRFADKRFDIIIAQGVFEYLGDFQSQKFAEIAEILKENGTFIVSYWNYAHRNRKVYWAHSHVQSIDDFRESLARHFNVDRLFPASHNWYHGSPSLKLSKAVNMHINMHIPFISPILAVEYFFLCSPLGSRVSRARREAGLGRAALRR